jgi:hypothetical protein
LKIACIFEKEQREKESKDKKAVQFLTIFELNPGKKGEEVNSDNKKFLLLFFFLLWT